MDAELRKDLPKIEVELDTKLAFVMPGSRRSIRITRTLVLDSGRSL